MRVVILAVGTRGDVEPALALAWQLRERGHEISLSVPLDLVGFAREGGFDAAPVPLDTREFLQTPDGQRFLAAGNSREYVRLLVAKKKQIVRALHADLTVAVKDADVIVGTRLVEEEGASLAEALGVPFVALHYYPARSNAAYPSPFVTARPLPGPLNRLTHRVFERTQWRHNAADVNRLREGLGLRPVSEPAVVRFARSGTLELQAYSRFLIPELAGWNERRPLIGALRLRPEQRALLRADRADPELSRWLDDGEAPVYIGFGSLPVLDGRRLVGEVRRTAERLGVRVLLNAGWSDLELDGADSRVLLRRSVDHDQIFPRCRVAVHHGGAGSTAASVGAGLPTVICADFADRALWGRAVTRLGVGATTRFAGLDAERLTAAIGPLLGDGPTRRAREVAARMAGENAALRAAELIESR